MTVFLLLFRKSAVLIFFLICPFIIAPFFLVSQVLYKKEQAEPFPNIFFPRKYYILLIWNHTGQWNHKHTSLILVNFLLSLSVFSFLRHSSPPRDFSVYRTRLTSLFTRIFLSFFLSCQFAVRIVCFMSRIRTVFFCEIEDQKREKITSEKEGKKIHRKGERRQISSEVEDFKLSVTSLIPFFSLNLYISFFYCIFCCIFSFSLSILEDLRSFIVFLIPSFPALFKSFKINSSMRSENMGSKRRKESIRIFIGDFLRDVSVLQLERLLLLLLLLLLLMFNFRVVYVSRI